MSSLKSLKSAPSEQETFVCFRNETDLSIDVYWINYKGARVKYKTLTPSQTLDVITFVGHPWIFVINGTGQRVLANKKLIFKPKCYIHPITHHMVRKLVSLTIPIYSLKECCFNSLKHKNQNSLPLPPQLSNEFKKFLTLNSQ
ncbi:unnamed protein product [Gordionus sp. m RMFG-2023]